MRFDAGEEDVASVEEDMGETRRSTPRHGTDRCFKGCLLLLLLLLLVFSLVIIVKLGKPLDFLDGPGFSIILKYKFCLD